MTSDQVYKLIEDNGLTLHGDIEHFAELVRKDYSTTHANIWLDRIHKFILAEREACAKVCEAWQQWGTDGALLAKAIRARGDKHD